ncbi:MAG: Bax inhibitor-1/YccA family protein [Phycisphaerales bacterium]
MFSLQSSNPALNVAENQSRNPYAYQEPGTAQVTTAPIENVTTLSGVVNKTAILIGIAVAAGAVGYALVLRFPQLMWISAIAAFVLVLGFGFVLCRKPKLAAVIGPIYAVVEGIFLGGLTAVADNVLAAKGLTALGGVGLQAFIITMAVVLSMLGLYKLGIVRPTERFKAVVYTLTGAIMLAYLVSFIMSFFGTSMPLISFASAVNDTGMMGFLGLGINLFILLIASLFLVIDFGQVEEAVANRAPKYMEWFLAFALLITLAWIYFEAVKLVVRLAVIFGDD